MDAAVADEHDGTVRGSAPHLARPRRNCHSEGVRAPSSPPTKLSFRGSARHTFLAPGETVIPRERAPHLPRLRRNCHSEGARAAPSSPPAKLSFRGSARRTFLASGRNCHSEGARRAPSPPRHCRATEESTPRMAGARPPPRHCVPPRSAGQKTRGQGRGGTAGHVHGPSRFLGRRHRIGRGKGIGGASLGMTGFGRGERHPSGADETKPQSE
jgi:hypothetical protein